MRQKLIHIVFSAFVVFCAGNLRAQQHVEFVKTLFPGKTAAFNVAYKQYKEGKKQFQKTEKTGTGSYEAIDLILQPAHSFNPDHEYLNFMLGVCRYHTRHYQDAYTFLSKAYSIEHPHDSMLYYYLGMSEHALMQYDSAIVHLQTFLTGFAGIQEHDSTASKRIEESKYGIILVQNPVHTKSESLGAAVNSPFNEYLPIIGHDGSYLIFNRDEPDSLMPNRVHQRIYITYAADSGWKKAEILPLYNLYSSKEFNALSLSRDGSKMLLRAKDKEGKYDLYESLMGPKGWGSPTLLSSEINTVHDETFAIYADHDSAIYFVSDRHGGYGNFDIWKAKRIDSFHWQKPVNLGSSINTPYNETYVSHPADSTVLFFISDGHATVGYTDIFRARFDEGRWQKPSNMGYPVNDSLEDAQFLVLPSGMIGLSVRYAGNQTDICKTFLPPKAKKPGLVIEERMLSNYPLIKTYTLIPKDE